MAASRGMEDFIGPVGECGVLAIRPHSTGATGIHLWSVGHLGTLQDCVVLVHLVDTIVYP